MALSAISSLGSAAANAIRANQAARLPALPSLATDQVAETQSFGEAIGGALDNLNGLHNTADTLAIQAATGDLDDVHDYTIAATQAELATSLTVAVRDRAVNAFNEIMRMPL